MILYILKNIYFQKIINLLNFDYQIKTISNDNIKLGVSLKYTAWIHIPFAIVIARLINISVSV